MANHRGSEGVVKISTNTVAEVRGWEITHQAEVIEDTVMADADKTFQSGNASWSGSVSCFWDETDTTGQGAMTAGASVTLNLYPEGASNPDTYYSGTALITNIARRAGINTMVEAEFSFQGTGALTTGTVP